jgi:NAD(P)H-nitrite reductase large subunit
MQMPDPEGAVLQRDGRTYAVVTRIPAGVVKPEDLEKIADVARKYRVPILKITSGQRIALVGLEPGDVQKVIEELGRWQSLRQPPASSSCRPVSVPECAGTGSRTR